MKVYVCESEYENDHINRADEVYATLDAALEKMRSEYLEYRKKEPNAGIEWLKNAEAARVWGWYDVDNSNGFTVRELELKGASE